MSVLSLFARARQQEVARTSNINTLAFRVPAYSAAGALVACAAWQSAGYAYILGVARSETTAYVFAAGAVAAAVLAPIALMVAFSERRRFLARLASLFLGVWCLAFGVVGSLGYVSTAREASNSERLAALEARQQAKARHDAASAELAQLSAGKSTQWRAGRAKELQLVMAEAAKALKAEKAVAITDPQAAAVAHYLTAAGFMVTADGVSTWLSGFMVTFYEVAGAFALVVARATAGGKAPLQHEAHPSAVVVHRRVEAPDDIIDGDDDDVAPPKGKAGPGRRPTVLAPEAIERLRQAGGRANGTVRGIGRLLGTRSKTASHRLLHQLASAGLVTLTATSGGTQVALA
jgi:hypothetical protein